MLVSFLREMPSVVIVEQGPKIRNAMTSRSAERMLLRRLTEFCGISDINPCQLKVRSSVFMLCQLCLL